MAGLFESFFPELEISGHPAYESPVSEDHRVGAVFRELLPERKREPCGVGVYVDSEFGKGNADE